MDKDTERRWMKLELNAMYPVSINPKSIVVTHRPELVEQVTETGREIIKIMNGSEYGKIGIENPDWKIMTPEEIKTDFDNMIDQMGTPTNEIVMSPSAYDWWANKLWDYSFLDMSNTIRYDGFLETRPLIPNRFDLQERARNDPKFECHQRITAHTSNPTKRKASKLARKARRNNR